MIETYKNLIINQYEAALRTLNNCVEACPDDVWHARISNFKFSHVVFHTLIFADFFLEQNESNFRDQQFHKDNQAFFNDYDELSFDSTETNPSKSEVANYLNFCREKVVSVVNAENEESLNAKVLFPRLDFTRAELYVYSIRHIQHHSAHLSLRLKGETGEGVGWVKSGWN